MDDPTRTEDFLRERAIARLKKRRDFRGHLLIYLLVNTALVVVWTLTDAGHFWPVYPMVFWGIGVVMNAWDVYRSDDPTEDRIQREMHRLSH